MRMIGAAESSFGCVFALALAALLSGCGYFGGGSPQAKEPDYGAFSSARLEKIKASGSFKVAVCPGYPPFAVKSDGRLVGLELEIIAAAADELKLSPQFIEVPREDASGMLRDGTVDLLCGAFSEGSLNRQYLEPALAYLPTGQRAIVRSEAAAFISAPNQLDSDKIVILAVSGSSGALSAQTLFPKASARLVPSVDAGLEELKKEEGCALLVDETELIKRNGFEGDAKVKALPGLLAGERLAFGLRRDDAAWKALLETGYRQAVASGAIGKLVVRYFPNVSVAAVSVVKNAKSENSAASLDVKADVPKTEEIQSKP